MALDFSDLKTKRSTFDNLMKEVEKISTPATNESRDDDRFWSLSVDKVGNGYAIIRFLPPPKGEDLPWVRIWNHGFQGPTGRWYIENSLSTLDKPDPVYEYNAKLWASGVESDKELARKQKRRLTYIANILVVKDPANPENEGRVKLFKFGKKIFDKIKDVMQPQFEDEDPINPFDFWKGANFKLKARMVEGYRNYDKSEFDAASTLAGDDKLETIWGSQYSLTEFLDPKNFKTYDELKARFESVINAAASVGRVESVELSQYKAPPTWTSSKTAPRSETSLDDDDESLSYFTKLANSDD